MKEKHLFILLRNKKKVLLAKVSWLSSYFVPKKGKCIGVGYTVQGVDVRMLDVAGLIFEVLFAEMVA